MHETKVLNECCCILSSVTRLVPSYLRRYKTILSFLISQETSCCEASRWKCTWNPSERGWKCQGNLIIKLVRESTGTLIHTKFFNYYSTNKMFPSSSRTQTSRLAYSSKHALSVCFAICTRVKRRRKNHSWISCIPQPCIPCWLPMQQPDHTSLLTLAAHQPNLLWPATKNQILKETGISDCGIFTDHVYSCDWVELWRVVACRVF